ncbi:MAG: hypothetical protein ACFWTJ_10050 [Lachnoclostridium sp.]
MSTDNEIEWDKEKVLQDIMENYRKLEKSLVEQLFFTLHNHGTTIGTLREDIWKSLFDRIVPKKFRVERSVFIIDSNFYKKTDEKYKKDSKIGISKEVDIAIFDESYTPYIFQFGRIKFIPIEAVAAVIECKSTSRVKEQLEHWTNSIKALKTSTNSIVRLANCISIEPPQTQIATRPIMINCYLSNEEEKEPKEIDSLFDIVLRADEEKKRIFVKFPNHDETSIGDWFIKLNHANNTKDKVNLKNYSRLQGREESKENYKKYLDMFNATMNRDITKYTVKYKNGDEVSLLSFNFMFNQLLMLINNPILFPHKAYVDMFCKVSEPERNE